jgi:hypothetical protein
VKVSSGNQTLLLARDRVPADGRTAGAAAQSITIGTGDAILRRVTIVAAQSESLLYLHADYASSAQTLTDSVVATVPQASKRALSWDEDADTSGSVKSTATELVPRRSPSSALKDPHGNPRAPTRDVGLSAYLKPTEQYALTQRITDAPAPIKIDVRA